MLGTRGKRHSLYHLHIREDQVVADGVSFGTGPARDLSTRGGGVEREGAILGMACMQAKGQRV